MTLKQEFLKKWIMGMKICKNTTNITERKKAIKVTADVAMACTRDDGKTCWSRALISKASKHKQIVKHILGHQRLNNITISKRIRSKKMIKRMRKVCKRSSSSIAKRVSKKRTQLLKRLVPGGELIMDDVSLLEETLDYIVALQAQIDVMRTLANAPQSY